MIQSHARVRQPFIPETLLIEARHGSQWVYLSGPCHSWTAATVQHIRQRREGQWRHSSVASLYDRSYREKKQQDQVQRLICCAIWCRVDLPPARSIIVCVVPCYLLYLTSFPFLSSSSTFFLTQHPTLIHLPRFPAHHPSSSSSSLSLSSSSSSSSYYSSSSSSCAYFFRIEFLHSLSQHSCLLLHSNISRCELAPTITILNPGIPSAATLSLSVHRNTSPQCRGNPPT